MAEKRIMGRRQCPYCGKYVSDYATQCLYCREALPPLPAPRRAHSSGEGHALVRRGLLYMLLAATFYYFAAGYSPLKFTFEIPPALTAYLLPLFFLSGLGLALFGWSRTLSN